LYGRAREIDTLLASFDRVIASGTPELVLVSGYSGIGKSSVVKELHKVLVQIWPGVQYPHCNPSWRTKAACIGWRSSPFAKPSMVVISSSACMTASVRQLLMPLPIDDHRAGAALPLIASLLRAGEREMLTQRIEQCRAGITVRVWGRPLI
jgi:hypothetical protein